ncbi:MULTISPECIES: class I SAM-dependent methyltransferase [unclassified Lysinibacillus]|uniref:class I SAM-dependent methyltransferase n=1 Tax=unclassified Lysinibacillus TaxID=2636778 RepID=UPI002552E960|nr:MULTISPECIES: class I SAM-dependent methyltransferase [unclassified Lysinibacillus]MDM5250910.1 class I SAM-dependent methyltransferase [Lysinibacillus sp. G4S2]
MEFNNTLANEYEKGIRRTLPSYDAMLRLTQTFYQSTLPEKADFLIVGSGSGNEILQLAEKRAHWSFVGIDPSSAMLQIAEERLKPLPNNMSLHQGTILDTLLPSVKFDAASCILVLHFINDHQEKLATLKEIANNLKPGAPFVLVSKYGQLGSLETELQFDLWRAYWLQHTKLSPSEVAEMEKSIRSLSFMREEDILSLLQQAGFTRSSRFFATTLFGGWICYKEGE